jgi:hypothetical protein
MTSKVHMQVHTNRESCEKQPWRKPRPNRAKKALGRPAWPVFGPVRPPLWPSTPSGYLELGRKEPRGDSFIIRHHKTENKKQIGSRREHSWPSSTSEDSKPWSELQWVTLSGKVLVCPRSWRGILSCNHRTYVFNLLLSYSCWWSFNLNGRLACFGDELLIASLSCSFCSLCDYRRVVTVHGRENISNLVHTLSFAYLAHINVLCTWCSITDYPLVVTSTWEGKGWTRCTFTLDRLDRVVHASWLHLQVTLDPLNKLLHSCDL